MKSLIWYAVIGVLAVISVYAVVFGLIHGSGTPRKKLLRSVLLLGGVALLCFGSGSVLSLFGMGWRCGPRNFMLFLCAVLIAVTSWRCMNALTILGNTHPKFQVCAALSLALVIVLSLFGTVVYMIDFSWNDWVTVQEGVTIVTEGDGHGSVGQRRCFIHINDLVHGRELEYDWRNLKAVIPKGL